MTHCKICGGETDPPRPMCKTCPPMLKRLMRLGTRELLEIKERCIDKIAAVDFIVRQRALSPRDTQKENLRVIKP